MEDWKMSWAELDELSGKIAASVEQSGFNPDFIVCISRGGLILGRLLSAYLNKPLAVVSASSYSGRERGDLKMNLTFSSVQPVKGKVLLADDIADTGATISAVYSALRQNPEITELKTAALVLKSFSKFKPDFCGAQYDGWVVFPYIKKFE